MTLHPIFRSSFLILGPIIGIHGGLTMLLSVFSDLGAWYLFSRIIEYQWFRSCPFSTNISTRKFNLSSRYFSEHNFFALDTNPLKMPLINAGLTYECGFIWTFVIAFFRCILNSYFPVPVFIIVRSKSLVFVIGLLFPLCILLLCFAYLKYSENYEIDVLFRILGGCPQHTFYTSTGLNLFPELLGYYQTTMDTSFRTQNKKRT